MRKLLLPALAACSMLAISAPVASATTHKAHASVSIGKKVSKALGQIKGVKKAIANIIKINKGQTGSIHDVDLRVDEIVKTLGAITAGVPAIVDGLTQLKAALQDPVTGLVGLNNARPQFGAFNSDGTIIAGTGQHPPAKGPSANATQANIAALGGLSGMYVVVFDNDVSLRFLTVNFLPTAPGNTPSGSPAQAVNCGSTDSAAALCFAIEHNGGAGLDKDVNKVAVKFGAGSAGTIPASGFSVTAISG